MAHIIPLHKTRRSRHRGRTALRQLLLVAVAGFAGTLAALHVLSDGAFLTEGKAIAAGRPEAWRNSGPSDRDSEVARFAICHTGGGRNCVVDGDTFWFAGEKYRIADIDTPETHPPRCPEEARLGREATVRLQHWLNSGAFRLEAADRDTDRYGRKLRIVTRGGVSVGDALIAEGLARPWEGRRRPWC